MNDIRGLLKTNNLVCLNYHGLPHLSEPCSPSVPALDLKEFPFVGLESANVEILRKLRN